MRQSIPIYAGSILLQKIFQRNGNNSQNITIVSSSWYTYGKFSEISQGNKLRFAWLVLQHIGFIVRLNFSLYVKPYCA